MCRNAVGEKEVVEYLKTLNPGLLPREIFFQFARIFVTITVEIVPLRICKDGKVEVLFLEREKDDPYFAGLMHTPGTVVLATDEEGSFESAFERIRKNELDLMKWKKEPVFVETRFRQTPRGREVALVHWVEMEEGEPSIGEYFGENAFPQNIVDFHVDMINVAVKDFRQK